MKASREHPATLGSCLRSLSARASPPHGTAAKHSAHSPVQGFFFNAMMWTLSTCGHSLQVRGRGSTGNGDSSTVRGLKVAELGLEPQTSAAGTTLLPALLPARPRGTPVFAGPLGPALTLLQGTRMSYVVGLFPDFLFLSSGCFCSRRQIRLCLLRHSGSFWHLVWTTVLPRISGITGHHLAICITSLWTSS